MDARYTCELLESLADGVNPITGEVLSDDDSCNQPDVIRALHKAVADMKGKNTTKRLPLNAGKPWLPEDEETLKRMFENGCSKKDICAYFIWIDLLNLGNADTMEQFQRLLQSLTVDND